jgi:hypothetical protein
LRTLTGRGWLEELPDPTGVRKDTRAYRATDTGRVEFETLWREAIETVDASHPLAFHVAITLTSLVTQTQYSASLAVRLSKLDERLALRAPADLPAQVDNALALWRDLAEREASWIRATLDRIEHEPATFAFAAE